MTEEQERHPRDQESGGDEGEELSAGEAAEIETEGEDAEEQAMESDQGE